MQRFARAVVTLAAAAVLAVTGSATAGAAPAQPGAGAGAGAATVAPAFLPMVPRVVYGDNYPANLRNAPKDSIIDQYYMNNRECTSYVAQIIGSRGVSVYRYGDAKFWDDNARANGFRVDNTPRPGSVAQTDAGAQGHVMMVDSISGNSVTVEDYNWDGTGHYLRHTVNAGNYRYIHFVD